MSCAEDVGSTETKPDFWKHFVTVGSSWTHNSMYFWFWRVASSYLASSCFSWRVRFNLYLLCRHSILNSVHVLCIRYTHIRACVPVLTYRLSQIRFVYNNRIEHKHCYSTFFLDSKPWRSKGHTYMFLQHTISLCFKHLTCMTHAPSK